MKNELQQFEQFVKGVTMLHGMGILDSPLSPRLEDENNKKTKKR